MKMNQRKGKVVPLYLIRHHVMNAYGGSRGIAPRILTLGISKQEGLLCTHRSLYLQGNLSLWNEIRRRPFLFLLVLHCTKVLP